MSQKSRYFIYSFRKKRMQAKVLDSRSENPPCFRLTTFFSRCKHNEWVKKTYKNIQQQRPLKTMPCTVHAIWIGLFSLCVHLPTDAMQTTNGKKMKKKSLYIAHTRKDKNSYTFSMWIMESCTEHAHSIKIDKKKWEKECEKC